MAAEGPPDTPEKEALVMIAGRQISCPRCQAFSKRSGQQCKKPAMRGKHVCRTHGGRSTGPKTEAGKQRCASAKTLHGRETRAKRQLRTTKLSELRELEQMMGALGLMHIPLKNPY